MKFSNNLAAAAVLSLSLAHLASAQPATPAAASSVPAIAQPAPAASASLGATQAASDATATPSTAQTAASAAAPSAPLADATPALQSAAPDGAATAQIANPYGLTSLWAQGDFIARGTLIILGIMSFSTWYILVVKLIEQNSLLRQAKTANKNFWKARSVNEGTASLPPKSPFFAVASAGLSALDHHEGTLVENIDLNTWVTLSIQRVVDRIISGLQGGLAVLATVGSTAPFVGLFGTVWGIYHALIAIGIAGQASIDKVAGPVGESLIMTALGLFTAVPAVLGYNWLVRRNKLAVEKLRGFANDLHSVLLSGKVPGRLAEPAQPTPAAARPVAVARSA